MGKRVYLDYNASTPVDPAVVEAMRRSLAEEFGNPSSGHSFGETARRAVESAREQTAALLGCAPERIIFGSGGTEANNSAILSAILARPGRKHLLSSQVEHPSVLRPLALLAQNFGYEVELLPVDEEGGLDLARLAAAIRPDTALVSLMAANNETGVLWDMAAIGAICRERQVLCHCDTIQLAGKAAIAARELPVDYLTIAGHKLHGPKGVGALYAHPEAPVSPLVVGAGQENGRRGGTENVAGIVGLGLACELAEAHLGDYRQKVAALRDRIEEFIRANFDFARINGGNQPRLANTVNVSFEHCASAQMIQDLDDRGYAVSAHAACQSGDLDPSHVLAAMRLPESFQHGTLRISLSRMSTAAEVEGFLALLPEVVARSRQNFV